MEFAPVVMRFTQHAAAMPEAAEGDSVVACAAQRDRQTRPESGERR